MQDRTAFLKRINETHLFYFLWSAIFVLLATIAIRSDGTYDTGDGISHYIISRFSFQHPELFYDLWGKPLFTLLSSPFSQFGLKGIAIFNITCGMLSALCAFRIAKLIKLKHAWAILFFCIFSPIYFGVLNSGLTEPLFSLLLVFSILRCFQGKGLQAAFIFSFAPFVRPEANFLIPVFVVYFLFNKNFKAIPLLFAGTVLFSVIGYFHFHDILWLKTQSPYTAANGMKYGEVHGEFFSYLKEYEHLIGKALLYPFVAGCFFFFLYPFIRKFEGKVEGEKEGLSVLFFKEEFLLLYGCLFAVIIVHTVVWWKGIFPTLGLLRYMSNIIPLASILCLRGLNFIFIYVNSKWIRLTITIIFCAWIFSTPFNEFYYPFTFVQGEEAVVKQSSDWLLKEHLEKNMIYSSHPYSIPLIGIDPYDGTKFNRCVSLHADKPGEGVPVNSIIIWDAHYSAHDDHLPAKIFLESSDFKLLKKFEPPQPFTVFGDTPFEMYIFQRI